MLKLVGLSRRQGSKHEGRNISIIQQSDAGPLHPVDRQRVALPPAATDRRGIRKVDGSQGCVWAQGKSTPGTPPPGRWRGQRQRLPGTNRPASDIRHRPARPRGAIAGRSVESFTGMRRRAYRARRRGGKVTCLFVEVSTHSVWPRSKRSPTH
ncbi:hypothetical protein FMEAI12_3960017 [Parafrankia sp. Ea1.12]|nr:hypothetical protein FMEAI12_3960017 [Parafrankia sp. Ea1.12]